MIIVYLLVMSIICSTQCFSSEKKKQNYFVQWISPCGITTFHKLKKKEDFINVSVKTLRRWQDAVTYTLVYRIFQSNKKMKYAASPSSYKKINAKFFFDPFLNQSHTLNLCVSSKK